MSAQLNVINDTLNLLRGKTVRFILEDVDLRMIRNLVNMIDEMDLAYDQEKMIYVDPHRETRGQGTNIPRTQLAAELEPGLNALFGSKYAKYDPNLSPEQIAEMEKEEKRLETNRKAREKYHAKKQGQKPKKRGRPSTRKAA